MASSRKQLMGGNLGSKETKQTAKPTRITSQGISCNSHTFVGQGWKPCYGKAQEATGKHKQGCSPLTLPRNCPEAEVNNYHWKLCLPLACLTQLPAKPQDLEP